MWQETNSDCLLAASRKEKPSVLTTQKELNPANNHMSLEIDPLLVEHQISPQSWPTPPRDRAATTSVKCNEISLLVHLRSFICTWT